MSLSQTKHNDNADHGNEHNPNRQVELCLNGTFSPKEFHDTVREFVGLISSVSENISPEVGASTWAMSVAEGSMVIVATPNSDKPGAIETVEKSAIAINQGLQSLESGSGHEWPDMFLESAVKHVRNLARLIESTQGDKQAEIESNGTSVSLSPRIARNAHALLEPRPSHTAYGNVEGELRTISIRKGFRLVVYRSLDGKSVECEPAEPSVESEAMKAFGKRVSVEGIVKYNGRSIPTSVIAKRIRVFRPDSELTPLSEIRDLF